MDDDSERYRASVIVLGNGIVRDNEPQPDVVEALFAILAREDTFNIRSLKRRLCPWMHDAAYGVAFTAARDRAKELLYRDFKSQGAGEYVLSNAADRVDRGVRQVRAANHKMIRGLRTLAIPGDPTNVTLERSRLSHIERANFQLAKRVVIDAGPLPNVAPRARPARPPIQEMSGYPTVPPRTRYQGRK